MADPTTVTNAVLKYHNRNAFNRWSWLDLRRPDVWKRMSVPRVYRGYGEGLSDLELFLGCIFCHYAKNAEKVRTRVLGEVCFSRLYRIFDPVEPRLTLCTWVVWYSL